MAQDQHKVQKALAIFDRARTGGIESVTNLALAARVFTALGIQDMNNATYDKAIEAFSIVQFMYQVQFECYNIQKPAEVSRILYMKSKCFQHMHCEAERIASLSLAVQTDKQNFVACLEAAEILFVSGAIIPAFDLVKDILSKHSKQDLGSTMFGKFQLLYEAVVKLGLQLGHIKAVDDDKDQNVEEQIVSANDDASLGATAGPTSQHTLTDSHCSSRRSSLSESESSVLDVTGHIESFSDRKKRAKRRRHRSSRSSSRSESESFDQTANNINGTTQQKISKKQLQREEYRKQKEIEKIRETLVEESKREEERQKKKEQEKKDREEKEWRDAFPKPMPNKVKRPELKASQHKNSEESRPKQTKKYVRVDKKTEEVTKPNTSPSKAQDVQPKVAESFAKKYDFRLACGACYISTAQGCDGIIYNQELVHRCARDTLMVAAKNGTKKSWVKVRPRPTMDQMRSNRNFSGQFRFCKEYTTGEKCTLGEQRCTFCHNNEERDIWTMALKDKDFKLKSFLSEQKGWALRQDERLATVQSSERSQKACQSSKESHPDISCPFDLIEICGSCLGVYGTKAKRQGEYCSTRGIIRHQWTAHRVFLLTSSNERIRPLPKGSAEIRPCPHWDAHCARGSACLFAHGDEEEVWKWMKNNMIKTLGEVVELSKRTLKQKKKQSVIALSQIPYIKPASPFKKAKAPDPSSKFHCNICNRTLATQLGYDRHCLSAKHEENMMIDREKYWMYRPPPWGGNYKLCLGLQNRNCPYVDRPDMYNRCQYAHNPLELEEWKERSRYRSMRKKMMTDGVFSYIHCLQEEYSRVRHQSDMMCNSLSGVEWKLDPTDSFFSEKKDVHHDWEINITSKEKLHKVCLLHNESRLHFNLSTNADGDENQLQQIEEGQTFLQHQLKEGHYCYKVKVEFSGGLFGSLKQMVVFDFGSRPLLAIDLNAEIGHDFKGYVKKLRTEPKSKRARWTPKTYKIIPFSEGDIESGEDALLSKYKAPDSRIFSLDSLHHRISRNNYVERMHQLINMEELQRTRILSRFKLEDEVQLSEVLPRTTIKAGDGRLFCQVPVVDQLIEDSNLGQLLLSGTAKAWVAPKDNASGTVYEAVIVREDNFGYSGKGRDFIFLCLSARCCEDLAFGDTEKHQLEVQLQIDRLPFCRMHHSVDKLTDTKKAFPDFSKFIEDKQKPKTTAIVSEYYNGTQKEIIGHMLTVYSTYCPPMIIYGPFGCGKSETLGRGTVEIIKNRPGSKVLICTLNDSAADLFISRYFKLGIAKKRDVVRIYSKERDPASISSDLRPYCLYSTDRKSLRLPNESDIAKCRITVTSLATSHHLAGLNLQGQFSHIIIDEAGQCMECEAVMPLTLANDQTCVIMAGDHMQLRPKSYSYDILPSHTRQLHDSPLVRLNKYYQDYGKKIAGKFDKILKVNYRSHQRIISFVSHEFYGDAIECRSGWTDQTSSSVPALQFHSTYGKEDCYSTHSSPSYYNSAEVQEVVQLVNELYSVWPKEWGEKKVEKIACITSYTQQVKIIKSRLMECNPVFQGIKVSLVGDIQGEEYFAVFLSTVRTHKQLAKRGEGSIDEEENMGFFSDTMMLNTAMTRAKCAVYVIGNPVSLCALGPCRNIWRSYLEQCKSTNTLFPKDLTIQSIHTQADQLKLSLAKDPSLSSLWILNEDICDLGELAADDIIKQLKRKEEIGQPKSVQKNNDEGQQNQQTIEIIEEDEQTIYRVVSTDDKRRQHASRRKTRWKRLLLDLPQRRAEEDSDDELGDDEGSGGRAYRDVIYQDLDEEELLKLLSQDRDIYKHCQMIIEGSSRMLAHNLDRNDKVHTINISSRMRCNRAFDGDEVVVEILRMGNSKDELPQGKVLGILKRVNNPKYQLYICRVDPYNTNLMLPLNRGIPKLYNLVHEKKHKNGYVVVYRFGKKEGIQFDRMEKIDPVNPTAKLFVVKFLKWEAKYYSPLGIVVDVLPAGSKIEDGEAVLKVEYNLREKYQRRTLDELERMYDENFTLPEEVIRDRLDYREVATFTVDPDGSLDLDDAISVEILTNAIRVGVHIADVGFFVAKGSAVDQEARVRTMTYYPPKSPPVAMLPPQLSNGLCSLQPGEDRLAVSVFIDVDLEKFEMMSGKLPEIEATVIRNKRQFTYEEVQQILDKDLVGTSGIPEEFSEQLQLLDKIAKSWRYQRLGNSANDIDGTSTGNIDAHRLVEEMMIRTNHVVAGRIKQVFPNRTPLRIQQLPNIECFNDWFEENKLISHHSLGLSRALLGLENTCTCQSVCHCFGHRPPDQYPVIITRMTLKRIKAALEQGNLKDLMTLYMKSTLYPQLAVAEFAFRDIQERGLYLSSGDLHRGLSSFHCTLNLDPYTHFTSPIRRYIDIVVHRILCDAITNVGTTRYGKGEIRQLCDKSNQELAKQRQYDKAVKALKLNVVLKDNPLLVYPVVDRLNDTGFRFRFPTIESIGSSSGEVSYADLSLKELPVYDPEKGDVSLKWNERIYDYDRKNKPILTVSQQEVQAYNMRKLGAVALDSERFVVNVPSRLWLDVLSSIRSKDEKGIKSTTAKMVNVVDMAPRELRKLDITCEAGPNDTIKLSVNFQMVLRPSQVHHVQLTSELQHGRLTPQIQLLNLTDTFDICVEHNRDPVKCFATQSILQASRDHEDVETYRKRWTPLVHAEAALAAVKEHETFLIHNVHIKWKKQEKDGRTLYTGTLELQREFCGDRGVFDFDGPDPLGEEYLCVRYSRVPLDKTKLEDTTVDPTYVDDSVCFVAHCIIKEQSHKDEDDMTTIKLRLHQSSTPFPEILLTNEFCATVEAIALSKSHRRMLGALSDLKYTCELTRCIALGKSFDSELETNADTEMLEPDYVKGLSPANSRQQEAVTRALKSSFTLIHGPPGTGKTITGTRIAYLFSELNKKNKLHKKVLYCGPSNKSVEVVAGNLKLIQNYQPELVMVRAYNADIVKLEFPLPTQPRLPRRFSSETGQRNALDECHHLDVALHRLIRNENWTELAAQIRSFDTEFKNLTYEFRRRNYQRTDEEKESVKRKVGEYKKLVFKASQEVLKKADIVLCTCTGVASKKFEKIEFKQVIIDEAGMCTEPECLVPLVTCTPEQIVLIGDHKQLQPIILSEMSQRLGMKRSLFERYVSPEDMLTTQYRMHDGIAAYPSESFYKNQLNSGLPRQGEPSQPHQLWPGGSQKPIVFVDIRGVENALVVATPEGNEQSKYNEMEADYTVMVVVKMVNVHNIRSDCIMVLTQYRAQKGQIQERLQKKNLHNVEVSTVIKSQGSERDFIVMSAVRSLPDEMIENRPTFGWIRRHLGFIANENQVNVAITRARKGLVIIGNQQLLRVCPVWEELFEHYQQRRCIVNPEKFNRHLNNQA